MSLPSFTQVASGLLLAAFVVVMAAGLDLTRVRLATRMLKGRADLDRFRRAIDRQRYLCLGLILLFVGWGVVVLVGLLGGWCRPEDVSLEVASGVPLLVSKLWLRYVEAKFKAVPTANAKVQAAWNRALWEWEESPIPDWSF